MHSDLEHFIALVGSPNAGKTTLFNALTGSRFQTVNYPGSTVEYSVGSSLDCFGSRLQIMDTPGSRSLFPKSLDEEVCLKALFQEDSLPSPDLVVSLVDATQLARHLLLVNQLKAAGFRVVVALTMNDLLGKAGKEASEKALAQKLGVPVVKVDGRSGRGLEALMQCIRQELATEGNAIKRPERWDSEQLSKTMKEQASIQEEVLLPTVHKKKETKSSRFDRIAFHPIAGVALFVGIMAGIFTSIFWLADPFINWIDLGVSALADQVSVWSAGTLWGQFLSDGLITGIGSVIVFVPQIAILFLGLSFLESSGYLARAASLIDRPLKKIGLNGRSFVPLLSGFACAIPAMMAARTITNKKERWLTLFIIPLMSCSARLPVYALLLAFLFHGLPAWQLGLAMTGIYFGSLLIGSLTATVAGRFIPAEHASFLMLELPRYRWPRLREVLQITRIRTMSFVKRAGPVILIFSLLIWVGTTFPKYKDEDSAERLRQSYFAKIGQSMEPVLEPMGVDWRVGVGLISAFAAREVFVPAMAVVFNVTEKEEGSLKTSLLQSMALARAPNGHLMFTTATIIGLILYFMIALQCMSTVAVARREFGNWRAPIIQLVAFNVFAYVLAVGVVQGLRAIGIS